MKDESLVLSDIESDFLQGEDDIMSDIKENIVKYIKVEVVKPKVKMTHK
jgi:hypothetical protein